MAPVSRAVHRLLGGSDRYLHDSTLLALLTRTDLSSEDLLFLQQTLSPQNKHVVPSSVHCVKKVTVA